MVIAIMEPAATNPDAAIRHRWLTPEVPELGSGNIFDTRWRQERLPTSRLSSYRPLPAAEHRATKVTDIGRPEDAPWIGLDHLGLNPSGAGRQIVSRPSLWWSLRNIAKHFLLRMKNAGPPWLRHSEVSGRASPAHPGERLLDLMLGETTSKLCRSRATMPRVEDFD